MPQNDHNLACENGIENDLADDNVSFEDDIEKDLTSDPFADDMICVKTSALVMEEERTFKKVAKILNSKSHHDAIIAVKSIHDGITITRIQEKPHKKKKAKLPETEQTYSLEKDSAKLDKILEKEKAAQAQIMIKEQLRIIRNKIKNYYKQIKANEQIEKHPNHQLFVDYILLEMAGITKNSNEYQDFKNKHYHTLVICMVRFMNSYTKQGLHRCTHFSAIQLAFRNYLYEKISPKQIQEAKEVTPAEEKIALPATANVEQHVTVLERLCNILQTISHQLNACFTHMTKPFCSFFRRPSQEHIVLDEKKNTVDSKPNSL